MSSALTTEQTDLKEMVREFLAANFPESAVRAVMSTEVGFDENLWMKLAELGLPGLLVPEQLGGSGGTFADLAAVMEPMGAALLCAPYLSSAVLAVTALLAANDSAQERFLPRIADGSSPATMAVPELGPATRAADAAGVAASRSDGAWRLSGVCPTVLDGMAASIILVPATTPTGLALFAVDPTNPGIARVSLNVLDETRKMARIELRSAEAILVSDPDRAQSIIARSIDLATAALSIEQVGAAGACMNMAVEYARTRKQFGRTIGSFQAIKHKCADMLIEVESAYSTAMVAVGAADGDDLALMGSLAKASCSDALTFVARENIQIHGGIGFTWEHPAHLYYRRAHSSSLLFGDPTYQRRRAAEILGLG